MVKGRHACIVTMKILLGRDYCKPSDRSPGLELLSVQLNQTPGLYARPGVYPGPGLYRNMPSLCYFIHKSRQLSCLPGTSILFIFTLKHLRLAEKPFFILYSYCGNDVIACCFTSILTHSLTHCCAWPAEGRSVLHKYTTPVFN